MYLLVPVRPLHWSLSLSLFSPLLVHWIWCNAVVLSCTVHRCSLGHHSMRCQWLCSRCMASRAGPHSDHLPWPCWLSVGCCDAYQQLVHCSRQRCPPWEARAEIHQQSDMKTLYGNAYLVRTHYPHNLCLRASHWDWQGMHHVSCCRSLACIGRWIGFESWPIHFCILFVLPASRHVLALLHFEQIVLFNLDSGPGASDIVLHNHF